jgi:hypothetical protein
MGRRGSVQASPPWGAFVVAAGGLDADDGLGEELLTARGAGVREA